MNFWRSIAAILALTSSLAWADCDYPATPGDPPSGNTATIEQMKGAKALANKYVEIMGEYLTCIDAEANAQLAALGSNPPDAMVVQLKNKYGMKHRAAEEARQKYADALNAEIRAFKAKNAQP